MNARDSIAHYLSDSSLPLVKGWATVEKLHCLYDLIQGTEAKTSVEIGVFGGRGTLAMAFAHRELEHERGKGNGGVCHAIDPMKKEPCLEGTQPEQNSTWWSAVDLDAVFEEFLANIAAHHLEPWINVQRVTADEAVVEGMIDVLHLDGNHTYEVVSRDVERWGPRIRPGGYMVMDDTDWDGPKKASELLLAQGFEMTEDHLAWAVFRKSMPTSAEMQDDEKSIIGDVEHPEVNPSNS